MCKHDFQVYVSDKTVVTFCSKCGLIGDVEMKPSTPQPVYPLYPLYPEYPYQWWTTTDDTLVWNPNDTSGTFTVVENLTDQVITSGTLVGVDNSSTTDQATTITYTVGWDTNDLK